MDIDPHISEFIEKAKVARLATIDSGYMPHLVPVVFIFDGNYFIIPIDEKKKTVKPEELKRVKNIKNNPNVALLIDEYDDDWTRLYFIMIQGKASIKSRNQNYTSLQDAYGKIMTKYPQYQKIGLSDVCIVIEPEKVVSWSGV